MPFQGHIFYEDVDNATTLQNINVPTSDAKLTISAGDFARVPDLYTKLIMYHAQGANITRARLIAPSMRTRGDIEILPIDNAAEPTSNFRPQKQLDNPITLTPSEKLSAETINSGAAAIEQAVAYWLCDEVPTPIKGAEIFHVDFSVTFTTTLRVWRDTAINLGRALEAGKYAVVGMRAQGATLLYARLIFSDDASRPMVIGYDSDQDIEDPIFRNGMLGEFGRFKEDAPPRLEVFCDAADTSFEGILDIIKVE